MTQQQIDSICDEFQAALRRGDTVRVQDVLLNVEASLRQSLLQELLEIKIQFAVESRQSEEYISSMVGSLQNSFPDCSGLIQSLLWKANQLQHVGDYEINRELGRGGMGTVYKAKHKLLQQTVAIKVLSQTLLDDANAVGRFRREMQLIGSLSHPNIVRALNAGEVDGIHYIAMEYVDGITLQKLVEKVRTREITKAGVLRSQTAPQETHVNESEDVDLKESAGVSLPLIPLGAACEMIRQAAIGLQNAHEFRLVHRDIKPANLMLDNQGTVKLLDLGLGKFADEHRRDYHSSLTVAGMVIGTVDYVSPEQCEDSGTADTRSDLYSLGCTLYFLLTGEPVYSGSRYDTLRKKLMGHIVGAVPSLRQKMPDMPLAFEAILQKVMSKDPAERFQTPIEFAEALAPFASFDELWKLACEMIPLDSTGSRSGARPSSSPYGFATLSKQNIVPPVNRTKWVVFFVVLNFLAIGLGIGAVHYVVKSMVKVDHEAAQQEEQRKAMWAEAKQSAEAAMKLREKWKISEAQAEDLKAIRVASEEYYRTHDLVALKFLVQTRFDSAALEWYHGDSRGASNELLVVQSIIGNRSEFDEYANVVLAPLRMYLLERRGDITLFGGAASGLSAERLADGILLYNEAAKIGADNSDPRQSVIRWKQAMLLAISGDVEQMEGLLERYPLPDGADAYVVLVRQLAEAMLFYYQGAGGGGAVPENGTDRNRKLWTFQQQFTSQSSPARGLTTQPEIIELLFFCAEFLVYDATKNEDWETLSKDIASVSLLTTGFVRQYPGSIPFMRRYYELFIRSAVLLHTSLERPSDKREQINNIVRLLDRMRPLAEETDAVGMERSTLVLFFLSGTMTEPGFVVFYPQDGREGTLYRLSLTRRMVKQPVSGRMVPELDAGLLERIKEEKAAERRIRVSWIDSTAWARAEEALSEKDYPYKEVLPLE